MAGRRVRLRSVTGAMIAIVAVGIVVVGPATPATAASCRRGHVALTFDDGPSRANAPRLLEILHARRAPATFFLAGRNVTARPGHVRRIARAGHTIYNHTYDHSKLTTLSSRAIRRQMMRTERALTAAGAPSSARVMRPPYGAINARVRSVLARLRFRPVLWTVDTRDWQRSTTSRQIVRTVVRGLAPGANILLHDQEDTQATVAALPRVISAVRTRGYCLGVVDRNGRVVPPRS